MQNYYTWYNDKANLDSPDTIHQILSLGTLEDVRAMKAKLGEEKLKNLFVQYPKKVYTKPTLNFIKRFILHINQSIHEDKYLKYTPRNIR